MRVIAGEFRGRRLKTLPGLATRPTPDRLREALFNVLQFRIAGAVFVDAYAGSGAVGIEALSRGAARAVFIERARAAAGVIRHNLASLGLENRADVQAARALDLLPGLRADIVFLDPPYDKHDEYGAALALLGVCPPPLVVAQHPSRRPLAEAYGRLRRSRVLRQGDNSLSFFEPATVLPPP